MFLFKVGNESCFSCTQTALLIRVVGPDAVDVTQQLPEARGWFPSAGISSAGECKPVQLLRRTIRRVPKALRVE